MPNILTEDGARKAAQEIDEYYTALVGSMVDDLRHERFQQTKDTVVAAVLAIIQKHLDRSGYSLGVGDGSGQLFVHGNYDAIKRVRALMSRPKDVSAISAFAQWFTATHHLGYEYDSPNQEHHRVKEAFMAGFVKGSGGPHSS